MRIAFNPSTVKALIAPPNNKDITFDLRGQNIFARGVKFCGTDTNTWRDIKINNVSIGSNILDLRDGNNTTLTNIKGVVTINSTWRPVVDNLTSGSTTSSLSANQGRVLAGLINGKSDSKHNHDDRYVRKSGDTMLGALNFANGTWNLVGDDVYIGDYNLGGRLCIKSANNDNISGIAIYNKAESVVANLWFDNANLNVDRQFVVQNHHLWIQGVGTAGGNNNRLTLVSGMPIGLEYNTAKRGTILYSNGIAFADPYNGNSNNDSGWIRHLETSANSGTLEIAVGDDALNEEIHFRWYNTNSSVETRVHDITVPRATGTLALTSQLPSVGNGTIIINQAGSEKGRFTVNQSGSTTINLTDNNSTYNFSGAYFESGKNAVGEHDANNITYNSHTYYTKNGPSKNLGASTDDGSIYSQARESNWVAQIAQDYRNGRLFVRGKNNNVWQNWKRIAQYEEIPTSLPAKGGNADTAIQATNLTPENTPHYFRDPSASSRRGGMYWGSAGSESMSFVAVNSGTRFQFVGGSDIANWTSSTWQSVTPYLTIYSSGIVTSGSVTATKGFIKSGSSDSYVLLGGGGHKAISDFVRAFGTSNDNIDSDWGQSFKTFDPIPSGTPPEQNPNISILNIGEDFNRRKQLAFTWNNDNIYYRRRVDGTGFTNWVRLALINDINNYYWANIKISTSSSTTTSPTVSNLTATSSIKVCNISLGNGNEINSANGSLYLNYRSSGNIGLCQGGGNVGIGTTTPSYKLDVKGQVRASGFIHSDHSINDSVLLAGGGYGSIFKLGAPKYYNNTNYALSFHKLSSLCNNLVWVDGYIWNSTSTSFYVSSDFYPYLYNNAPSIRTIYRMDGNNMITVDGNGLVVISCSSYPRRVGFFYTGRA